MKILIVDDERAAIKSLRKVLERVAPQAELLEAENAEEALAQCRAHEIEVVFLDIEMPDRDGLTLAREMMAVRPLINVVVVTAYPQYALDAFGVYASAYLMKPALQRNVSDALLHLRNPVRAERKGLFVQCFGNFEVFYDGVIVRFGRAKAKEMLAYLIDRRGASVTNSALRTVLWGDDVDNSERQLHYFAQIAYELRESLRRLGCADVLQQSRNSYAIVPEKIPCDYYLALEREPKLLSGFDGEYMAQYEWAEDSLAR